MAFISQEMDGWQEKMRGILGAILFMLILSTSIYAFDVKTGFAGLENGLIEPFLGIELLDKPINNLRSFTITAGACGNAIGVFCGIQIIPIIEPEIGIFYGFDTLNDEWLWGIYIGLLKW